MKSKILTLFLAIMLIGCDFTSSSSSASDSLDSSSNSDISSNINSTSSSNSSNSSSSNNNSSIGGGDVGELPDLDSYYSSLDTSLSGTAFLLELDRFLDKESAPSNKFSYNGSTNGMQTVFPYTDADPANPSNGKILSFYSGNSATWSQMNREHVWPNSRGGGATEKDPHVIRPTIISENSDRGNDFFNDASEAKWDPASFNNYKYRGIAARIIFYAAVRYQDSGLKLVDSTNDSTANKSMGKLSTLLKWNLEYGIDNTETLRNEVLFSKYEHCRNPFIDYPEMACHIWGNTNEATRTACKINY